MLRFPLLLALSLLLLATTTPRTAHAGGGPENLVLVVNADSWASLAIANEYIALRQIPPGNVVYLSDLADVESANVDQFRDKILMPVLKTIDQRGLGNQVDYIVYSSDIPYVIDVNPDLKNFKEKLPQVITPSASTNGLTFLYRYVLAKNPSYLRLDVNRYMRRPLSAVGEAKLEEAQQQLLNDAVRQAGEKKWGHAIASLLEVEKAVPRSGLVQYLLARARASLDQDEDALDCLERAMDAGFMLSAAQLEGDAALAGLKDQPRFAKLIERAKAYTFDVQPTRGFHANQNFTFQGEPSTGPEGDRYLLSTMLAMTSGRGNSVTEALAYLRSAAASDGTRPKGTIYYVKNGDVRSTTRAGVFEPAVNRLKKLGVAAEILDGNTPDGKDDVQGAMMGTAGFNWPATKSTIRPGAICEHLTSFGGVLSEDAGQTPLTEFLRYGAAGSSGTVTEPFAIQQKFPLAFLQVHYTQGCTLAESFYQSVFGPYQLLIVGDPLCRPWAKIPQVVVEGLPTGEPASGVLELRAKLEGTQLPIDRFELFIDGQRRQAVRPGDSFPLDTKALAEGHHDLRVVAITADNIQTQGRAVLPLTVRRQSPALKVEPAVTTVRWDQKLRLKLSLPEALQLVVLHNRREVASLIGSSGEVEIDPRMLGQGDVLLEPLGLIASDTAARVRGEPVRVKVVPPDPWPALKLPPSPNPAKGLRVLAEGGEPRAVEETRSADWLTKAGVEPGKGFEVSGYFDVPTDDVYQFQLRATVPLSVEVDGNLLDQPKNEGWHSLPVSLAAGTHQLRIRSKGGPQPKLEIRFGGPGMRSASSQQFRH